MWPQNQKEKKKIKKKIKRVIIFQKTGAINISKMSVLRIGRGLLGMARKKSDGLGGGEECWYDFRDGWLICSPPTLV